VKVNGRKASPIKAFLRCFIIFLQDLATEESPMLLEQTIA